MGSSTCSPVLLGVHGFPWHSGGDSASGSLVVGSCRSRSSVGCFLPGSPVGILQTVSCSLVSKLDRSNSVDVVWDRLKF